MAETDIELISEQKKELMAITALESDLDIAYQLQLEEALSASLALQPSSSSTSIQPPPEPSLNLPNLQTLKLDKFFQERKDRQQCQLEMLKITQDIKRIIHDQKFAQEIVAFPEREWNEYGEWFEKPFGKGSSSSSSSRSGSSGGFDEPCRLYFRGLVCDEIVSGKEVVLSGIGVAICDPKDNLLLKIEKPLLVGERNNGRVVELEALVKGLNAALSLDIKRIVFFCVNPTCFKQIIGRWTAKQRKVAALVHQVSLLQRKFEHCQAFLVAGQDVKFAFKFARDAIDSQITKSLESSITKALNETCSICLEDTDVSKMFAVDGCLHRYCFSCVRQHMEVKVLQGIIPACPHEGCNTKLSLDTSKKFLSLKLVEMMSQLMKEASIPVTEKIYCPYPKCSTLMSKAEALDYANNVFVAADRSGMRKCIKCHGLFCSSCKVPWHSNMTCHDYKRSNLSRQAEEAKLKSLASQKFWRQCMKCNHMIELAEGCYHMTCRCGYEFCYTCGAEWKDKKQSCTCPLWVEENILYDDEEDDFDEEDEDDDELDEYFGFLVG